MATVGGGRSVSGTMHLRSKLMSLVLLLSVPLLISLLIYVAATTVGGATTPPPIGYGLQAACPTSSVGGVAYIWLTSGSCTGSPVGFPFSSSLIGLLNYFFYFLVGVGAVMIGYGLIGAITEGHEF